MNCIKKDGRLYIDVDESTHLEFDMEGVLDKIEDIPVDYMSSEERNELLNFLRNGA